jgi:hypothetical protein
VTKASCSHFSSFSTRSLWLCRVTFFCAHADRTTRKSAAELEGLSSLRHWCSASADWLRPFHSCEA